MDALNREFVRLLAGSGWSQSRAARELHLDTGTVSRYVSGDTRPSMTVLKLFAEILRETVRLGDHLYTPAFTEDHRPNDSGEAEMLRAFRRLPLVKRQRLVDLATALAGLIEVDPPGATGIQYPPSRSGGDMMADKPTTTDPMPGIDPVVADTARAGALAAQRMIRENRELPAKRKAALTSENKSGRAAGPGAATSPKSEVATPAPARPSSQ